MQLPPPARRSQPVSRPVQGATVKPKTPKTVNKTVDPKTTTTATPKGSVSASGWLSWPKLCWHNALCAVFICLIAGACGGAFAYFSHGSDSLLPSIVVPDATALPTETERRIDQIVRVVRPMRPLAASPRKAWSARAASKHVAVCLTGDLRVPAVTFAHIEHHLLLPSASQEVLHMDVFYVGGKTPAFQELQGRIKLRGAFTYSAVNVGGAHERAESSQTALLESITNKTNVRTMHVPTLNIGLSRPSSFREFRRLSFAVQAFQARACGALIRRRVASSDEAPSPARQPLYYEAVLRLRPDLVLSTPFDWPCQLERARRRNGTIFAVGDYLAFGAAGVMAATALAARSSKHVEPLQNLKNVVWSHTNATGMEETGTGAATGGVARLCASCDRRTIDSQEDCALPVGACLVRSSPAAVDATTSAATMNTSSGTAENGRNDISRLCYSVVCESAGFHYPDDKPGIDGATRSKKGARGYNLTSGPGPAAVRAAATAAGLRYDKEGCHKLHDLPERADQHQYV